MPLHFSSRLRCGSKASFANQVAAGDALDGANTLSRLITENRCESRPAAMQGADKPEIRANDAPCPAATLTRTARRPGSARQRGGGPASPVLPSAPPPG